MNINLNISTNYCAINIELKIEFCKMNLVVLVNKTSNQLNELNELSCMFIWSVLCAGISRFENQQPTIIDLYVYIKWFRWSKLEFN